MIKKIELTLSSWFITPFESDTILSYIFAFAFLQQNQNIINIFEEFKKWNIPFNITNWFYSSQEKIFVPKPIFFKKEDTKNNIDDKNSKLKQEIENEVNRKKLKKISFIAFEDIKDYFTNPDEIKRKYIDFDFTKLIKLKQEIWKNSVPRFHIGETNPYSLSANFVEKITIYVKIYDENSFNTFFSFMKEILLTFGFGAWKSRWFWKIKKVELKEITNEEKETFDFLESMKKQWKYLILNNFKPSEEDLENIDFEKSNIEINFKHTKTLQELNENFFKWAMNFIKPVSYVVLKNKDSKLKGDFYQSWNSYNFGFIF